uniref:small proline-rich protein 2E-like n=1 Tax=Urocitellus parryii TaxID=9999 RepID=UPI000E55D8BF|nr:small proline-rich protein 2E-like [Urocitellus parryii]
MTQMNTYIKLGVRGTNVALSVSLGSLVLEQEEKQSFVNSGRMSSQQQQQCKVPCQPPPQVPEPCPPQVPQPCPPQVPEPCLPPLSQQKCPPVRHAPCQQKCPPEQK